MNILEEKDKKFKQYINEINNIEDKIDDKWDNILIEHPTQTSINNSLLFLERISLDNVLLNDLTILPCIDGGIDIQNLLNKDYGFIISFKNDNTVYILLILNKENKKIPSFKELSEMNINTIMDHVNDIIKYM